MPDNKTLTIKTSWPPSINTYWRRNGGRYFITQKGIDYRDEVISLAYRNRGMFESGDRVALLIEAYPPDKRRRDLDNILKPILDALQHAKIYVDDNQVDKINIWRCMPLDGVIVINMGLI
jgi:crossover junction endodeoxyribonuclease RusA